MSDDITHKIKKKALELGFDKVGVTPAVPLPVEREHFEEWLNLGYQGAMQWMEREPEKRADPTILFPGARSMVVVALNYYTPHAHENSDEAGKVSRYAWGDDYHDVVGDKLRELLAFAKSLDPAIDGKACVDTAPIMDKAWAVRAGLGWIGKHSNVITREFGSWFFIGEVLLNVELDFDTEIVPDHCGNCTACIDACPTDAIVQPFVVDSNRCISYATIELRTPELPPQVAENLNGWLYGCDICQDVCPWNRFQQETEETRFEPRTGNVNADISGILALSPETYAERFRRSAMKRTKLAGLQRNARALKKEKNAEPENEIDQ
jgi:epoxyqueuosine reductase